MKVTKKGTMSKEPVLQKVSESKQKILTPKTGISLEKALENVHQIFKKKNIEIENKKKASLIDFKPKSKPISKPKSKLTSKSKASTKPVFSRKPKQKKFKDTGIVYIGHIPHGFYEEQMEDYFKQFGKIIRTRVARSKKTGKSRGYGYVEFMDKDVAKIAAETMNNYLMCGRLLKATYIPPEKQHSGFFSGVNWSKDKYPKFKNRQRATAQRNNMQSATDQKNYVKSSLRKLSALESKLEMAGISIKFEPVDVPQL